MKRVAAACPTALTSAMCEAFVAMDSKDALEKCQRKSARQAAAGVQLPSREGTANRTPSSIDHRETWVVVNSYLVRGIVVGLARTTRVATTSIGRTMAGSIRGSKRLRATLGLTGIV